MALAAQIIPARPGSPDMNHSFQDGEKTTMALKTMPIAKLQDLKSKVEAALNAKVSERRRELETEPKAIGKPPQPLCGKSVTGGHGARPRKSSSPLLIKARHPSA
jgi:hypothetical protein